MVLAVRRTRNNPPTRNDSRRTHETRAAPSQPRHMRLLEHRHRGRTVVRSEHSAAVHRHASKACHLNGRQQMASSAEHAQTSIAAVSDDELVEGRRRDALGTTEHTDTDVADKLASHAKHAHAVVAAVGDGDATINREEAQFLWVQQLASAYDKPKAPIRRTSAPSLRSSTVRR
jgi:hypothetical protein